MIAIILAASARSFVRSRPIARLTNGMLPTSMILLATKQTRRLVALTGGRSARAAGGVAMDAANVGARRNRMRRANSSLRVAVFAGGTGSGCVGSATTCTCCCVASRAVLVFARAANRSVGRFDARIADAHDVSSSETVPVTSGIAEAGDTVVAAEGIDAAARLADGGGYLGRSAGG